VTAAIGLTAVAVVGSEPVSTGAAALDLARAEARHRRVLIVDLIGDAPPLRAVVATDDPHGVADAFVYGASFAAIARPSTVHPNISILSSGTEPVPYETALPSSRWTQLIEQVRARGELIVFAMLSSTPAIGALTDRVDCVIQAPSRLHEVLEAVLAAATSPQDQKPADGAPRAAPRVAPRAAPRVAVGRAAPSRRRFDYITRARATALAAVAAVLVIGIGWAVTRRHGPANGTRGGNAIAAGRTLDRADTETSSAQLAAGASDSAAIAAAASEVNPAAAAATADSASGGVAGSDSATADLYAVRVATYPTFIEALRALRQLRSRHPAITITPIVRAGESTGTKTPPAPMFALMVGAEHTTPPLDTLASHWPFQSGFAPSVVVHAPFALLLAGGLSSDSARHLVTTLVGRGVPAYALVSPFSGRVYAGAFGTVEEAQPLAASLRAIGLTPVVAYRTGHTP
jgi:hypothetical protein